MANKKITAIMMAAVPTKTEYVVGFDGLDLAGGLLNLVYEDGSFEQVPLNADMEYYVENNRVGQATVSVRYAGCQAGFPITIRDPKLSRVTIISPPNKTTYTEGENLDLTGLRLMGHYDDGVEREIRDLPVLRHKAVLGEAVVPLSIGDLLIPLLIQVHPSRPIKISMYRQPEKTVYLESLEDLDVKGGMVEKQLSNGRIELVPLTPDMVTGFDNAKVGKQSLTVSYGGQTCQYQVEVVARRCERLELRSLPIKRTYIDGERIQLKGIKVLASEKNHVWEVPMADLVAQPAVAQSDRLNISVSYQGLSVEFPILIHSKKLLGISLRTPPATTSYSEQSDGEPITIDTQGGQLELRYDNNSTAIIPLSEAELEPLPSDAIGPQRVKVTYQGMTTWLDVQITPKKLLGIYISKMPNKTAYRPGELFDPAGMEVTACYESGQTKLVERYLCPTRPIVAGETAVAISYIDKTAVVPITVADGKPGIALRPRAATPVAAAKPVPVVPQRPKAERFYPGTLGFRFADE